MTINLALEYIPRRMRELGYADNYFLRFRHIVLQSGEKLNIDGHNQLYLLVEEVSDISISSELGVFDLSQSKSNEMIYEHQGEIQIYNYSNSINHIRFIQVIPKNEKVS